MKNILLITMVLFSHQLFAQLDIKLIEVREQNNDITFYAESPHIKKNTVVVTFSQIINLTTSFGTNEYKGTVGLGRTKLFTLKYPYLSSMTNTSTNIGKYVYEAKYYEGCHNTKPDKDIVHTLPFTTGKTHKVYEMDNLSEYFGEQDDDDFEVEDFYALLFKMEKGDRILATRKGLVVEIKSSENIDEQEDSKEYDKEGNYLTIMHDDCTLSRYKIFKENSAQVKVGDMVLPGDLLALASGNSYEGGNQLRFSTYYTTYNATKRKAVLTMIKPNFAIEGTSKPVTSGEEYQSDYSEMYVTQEMTKREKKKRAQK